LNHPVKSEKLDVLFRQSLRTGTSFDSEKPQKPARIFGERTHHFPSASRISFPGRRITGPILTPLPEDPNSAVYPQQTRARIQLPTPTEDSGPKIIGGKYLKFILLEKALKSLTLTLLTLSLFRLYTS
jgi:hypothetical protein